MQPSVSGSGGLPSEALRSRLRGWLLARVLVVTAFLGAVAVTHLAAERDPSFPLGLVVGLIVFAYAFSIASAYAVGRVENLQVFAFAQIGAEILLISAAVLLTGVIESPMAVWYNLAIIGAAILLLRPGAYAAATLAALTYGALINLVYFFQTFPHAFGVPAPAIDIGFGAGYHLAVNIASFYSIAFLSSILADRVVATEKALEASEANVERIENLQKTLVQNLESGVLTTDATGIVMSANQAVGTIVGQLPAELIGRRISEIFPVLRPPVGAKRVLDPSPIPIELAHRQRPGAAEQIVRCTSARLTDTYQNLIGSLYILQDITALRLASEVPEQEPAPGPPAAPRADVPGITGFLGRSPRLLQVTELIHKAAPTESTILITGESGTGKELAARAVHALSRRRDKPMVVVNCAAIPPNLIESELFGHARGAFTGAVADRRGLFRTADGGTVFLDEVGDLPLMLQVKLLRVLQERSFTPVGGQSQVVVDVRIIAATNRELEAAVSAGNFREDLFYRLNVIRLQMPALRERSDDIPLLIDHFLAQFAEELNRPLCKLSPQALRRLLAHSYPGNIRELENVIEHAVALSEGETITEDDLPIELRNGTQAIAPPPSAERAEGDSAIREADWMQQGSSNLDAELESIEKRLLEEALKRAGGVRKRAAEILGINYRSLRHRLSKYGFGDLESRE